MNFQKCHCGWSKVTSDQDLRTHQKNKGCTGDRCVRTMTYLGPPISLTTDLLIDILQSSSRPVLSPSRITILDDHLQEESQQRSITSPNREIVPLSDMRVRTPERTPHTGLVPQLTPLLAQIQADGMSPPASPPPVAREAETPQMDQTFADAQQIGSNSDAHPGTASIPLLSQAPSMFSGAQISGNPTNPVKTEASLEMSNPRLFQTSPQVFGLEARDSTFSLDAQKSSPTVSATQISDDQTDPANKEITTETTDRTLFETPQKVDGKKVTGAQRALDFSTGAQQIVLPNPSTPMASPRIHEAREAETLQRTQTSTDSLQIGSNSAVAAEACETASVPPLGQVPSMFVGVQVSGNKTGSGNQTGSANTEVNSEMMNKTLFQTSQVFGTATTASTFSFAAQKSVFPNPSTPTAPPRITEAREAESPQMIQASAGAGARDTASVPLFGRAPSMFSETQIFGNQTKPASVGMSNQTSFETPAQVFGTAAGTSAFIFGAQKNVFTPTHPPRIPEAREAETPQMTQTFTDSLQLGSNSNRDFLTRCTASAAQFSRTVSATKISDNQTDPANREIKTAQTDQTPFQTPQKVSGTATGARQALGFSSGAQQMESLNIPTTTAQETTVRPKKKEKDRAKSFSHSYTGKPGEVACDVCEEPKRRAEKSCLMCVTSYCSTHLENHSAAQRLKGHKLVDPVANLDDRACLQHGRPLELFSRKAGKCICVLCMKKDQEVVPIEDEWNRKKAKLENVKLDLREKIERRITRIDEINESLKSCEDQLDKEERDIDAVFTAVITIVEEAYAAALQPLKDRRQVVEREAKDIEEKLEAEIEQLEQSISVLEDISALEDHILFLQTYPSLQEQDNIKDCPEGELDTSLSFGTLRKITDTMLESIQQELKKLTPIELQRIPKFTVDVTLDPTTAHQCLEISDDGKEVKDSGENQRVPDSLERFDMHGSVLGLNRFSSGKSYWEVEVGNKTGWDLGVARGRASRKGKLSLTPDNGYWVTVHFDDNKYAALTVPPVPLSLEEKPQTVGVFLDYDEGLVSFYDVTTKSHIYSFTGCLFSGDILPYFSPHVKTGDKNVDPLIISSLRK